MSNSIYAVFVKEPRNLQEAADDINDASKKELMRSRKEVVVQRTEYLKKDDYKDLKNNLIEDREWLIKKEDGGFFEGKEKVIKVKDIDTEEEFLIRTEGYLYPRYVGFEVR